MKTWQYAGLLLAALFWSWLCLQAWIAFIRWAVR